MQYSPAPSSSLALLAGAMIFSGEANASTAFSEDYESGAAQWASAWGTYTTSQDFSGSSHGQIPGGGSLYGHLVGASNPTVSNPVDLSSVLTGSELTAVANGNAEWNFDAWLAGYTDGDYAFFQIEWFDAVGGTGTSLGVEMLADGSTNTGVTESIVGNNPPNIGTWTTINWSHYVQSGSVPAGAVSFVITHNGAGGNGNDAYAELVQLDIISLGPPNLIVNGSFEDPSPAGWPDTFQALNYTDLFYNGPAVNSDDDPAAGSTYSWNNLGSQTIGDLATAASISTYAIDSDNASFTIGAWLASYSDPEFPGIELKFFDTVGSGGSEVGTALTFDADDPGGAYNAGWNGSGARPTADTDRRTWTYYETTAAIPAGARRAQVRIFNSGGVSGNPDTYVDGLNLSVTATEIPGQPTNLVATLNEVSGALTLDWTPPSAPFTPDEVRVIRDGSQIATLAPSADTFGETLTLSPTIPQTFQYKLHFMDAGQVAIELLASVSWVPENLPLDLVAYYRFEGDFRDSSGSATSHDGTPQGPPTINGGGIYGHCIEFRDQASPRQAVVLGTHSDFNFGASSDFSISLWFRRLGSMENNSALGGGSLDSALISDKNWSSGTNVGWGIFSTSDGGVKWNLSDGSTRHDHTIAPGFGSSGVADGQWHHLVVTHDRDGSARFYLDGTFTGSKSISSLGSINTGLPITIGTDALLQYPWSGSIDEVAIWRRALAADEVTALYEGDQTGLSITGHSIIDSDDDGMDDAWEQSTFGNLAQTAEGDFDLDGNNNFLEYAQGTAAGATAPPGVIISAVDVGGNDYPLVSYLRASLAGDVAYHVEFSPDLQLWSSGDSYFIPHGTPDDLGAGMERHKLRFHQPIDISNPNNHFRVRVQPRYQAALSSSVEPTVEFRNGSAVIRWETDTPTVTILDFGRNGTTNGRYEDYTLRTVHEVVIANVDPGEVLAFTVVAVEDGIETRSQTFSTSRAWDYSAPAIPEQLGYVTPGGWATHAANILALPGAPDRGYCLDLRCGGGELAFELARQSSLVVIAVEDTQPEVDAARQFLADRGVYGSRVTVVLAANLADLPFAPDTFNLVVSQSQITNTTPYATLISETTTETIPGRGIIAGIDGGSLTATPKAPATGVDDWSQQYGGTGNAGSNQESLGGKTSIPQFDLQWLGRPGPEIVIDRMVRAPAPLSANGRMYCQGLGRVLGLDSHNGCVLWSREVHDLRRLNMIRDASNMAAADEGLYLAVRKECWLLEGDSGARTSYDLVTGPNPTFDYHWGYVGRSGNQLLGSAMKSGTVYKQYWGQEFWFDSQSGSETQQVCSDNIFALDQSTGLPNWTYTNGLILNVSITIADGKVFFLETRNASAIAGDNRRLSASTWKSSLHLVCLDLATGAVLWDETPALNGGEPCMYVQYSDGRLVVTGSEQSNDTFYIYGFDPADGSLDWNTSHGWKSSHHGGNHQHPVLVNGNLYLEPHKYSLATGARTGSNVMPGRAGCSTFIGAKDVLFYRGGVMSGQYAGSIGMWDPVSGTTSATSRNRPGCWISWAPANGMILVQEQGAGCSCGSWMETSYGLAPQP